MFDRQALVNRAEEQAGKGDLLAARMTYEEIEQRCRDDGDREGLALSLQEHGRLLMRDDLALSAVSTFAQASELFHDLGDRSRYGHSLLEFANCLVECGDAGPAFRIYMEVEAIGLELGDDALFKDASIGRARIHLDSGDL